MILRRPIKFTIGTPYVLSVAVCLVPQADAQNIIGMLKTTDYFESRGNLLFAVAWRNNRRVK